MRDSIPVRVVRITLVRHGCDHTWFSSDEQHTPAHAGLCDFLPQIGVKHVGARCNIPLHMQAYATSCPKLASNTLVPNATEHTPAHAGLCDFLPQIGFKPVGARCQSLKGIDLAWVE